jgi:predicted nucleotidyltransferase
MQGSIDIKQNLDEISRIIAETVPVESIYLFGSYAYGTQCYR